MPARQLMATTNNPPRRGGMRRGHLQLTRLDAVVCFDSKTFRRSSSGLCQIVNDWLDLLHRATVDRHFMLVASPAISQRPSGDLPLALVPTATVVAYVLRCTDDRQLEVLQRLQRHLLAKASRAPAARTSNSSSFSIRTSFVVAAASSTTSSTTRGSDLNHQSP